MEENTIPNPKDFKDEQSFVSACIPIVLKEGTAKNQEQASAICYSMWRDKKNMIEIHRNKKNVFKYNSESWKIYLGSLESDVLPEIKIFKVDPDYVKKNYDPEFLEGTNWMANPEYCPEFEIWLAHGSNTLRHEFEEPILMWKFGITYEQAHSYCIQIDNIEEELDDRIEAQNE